MIQTTVTVAFGMRRVRSWHPITHAGVERLAGVATAWSTLMYHPFGDDRMPELEITEEQAAYLEDLRDAIESELVGPYGTVHRKDALQYLIDDFGAPDDLGGGVEPDGSADEETTPTDDAGGADADASEDEATADEADDGDGETDDAEATEDDTEADADGDGGGDDMLDEMMSLLDTHDDKWTEADTEETKYEVDLPDGDTETVQTQDDVRALLFKHYR
ncbi:MAG: hypothetical protein ACI91T_002159 [Natronomonas sp.]|jgi:hypothetical protein